MEDNPMVHRSPYRTSLLICVLFCTVTGIIVSVGQYDAYNNTVRSIHDRQTHASDLISEWLISSFTMTDYLLRDIIDEVDVQDLVYPAQDVSAQQGIVDMLIAKEAVVPNVILVGTFDSNCFLTAGNVVAPGFDARHRDYCTGLLADSTLETLVTPAIRSSTGPLTVIQARRIGPPGSEFQGFAAAGVNLDFFSRWLDRMEVSENSFITILDSNRMLLARKPQVPEAVGQLVNSARLKAFLASGKLHDTTRSVSPVDGIDRWVAYRKVAGLPLVVAVGQDAQMSLGAWYQQLAIEVTGMLLLWVMALFSLRMYWQRLRNEEVLAEAANTDLLTQLMSRRCFTELAEREIHRARRFEQPLGLLLIDLDEFKAINDTHGHAMGDRALIALAQRCQRCLREVDLLARLGGDEFVVLLPDTEPDQLSILAERLRRAVAESCIDVNAGMEICMTVSIGQVSARGPEIAELDELLGRADRSLYQAKRMGRNAVGPVIGTAHSAASSPCAVA